ncbi:MAG: SagB/ThcOx family dehydrogenase [Ketobacter sp.]|nr:MAG: SagB/ThcOx family dehydrogenase [Ketobacter sp.]
MSDPKQQIVIDYHDRTKHRMDGYAKGPDTLDWDAQPDPFRRFDGAEQIDLPLLADRLVIPFSALSSDQPVAAQSVDVSCVATLLEISVALSAWKQYGTARWSLRVNPSSGNLHPTETYLIAIAVEGLSDGLYHYRADAHALELRCRFSEAALSELELSQPQLYIGFSSVHWREAWKYGERAFRYCQHDVGHAMAAISYGAATLGWNISPQLMWGDDGLATLLGLDRQRDFGNAEREHPDLLLKILPGGQSCDGVGPASLLTLAQSGQWFGKANVLDPKHLYHWPVIDEVTEASQRPENAASPAVAAVDTSIIIPTECSETAGKLLRRRRSAQSFDGVTVMSRQHFSRCLDQLQPRTQYAPWNTVNWHPRIHLVLFIHRVEGIAPGLYALPRSEHGQALMRDNMRPEFQWQPVAGIPDSIPLQQLILAKAERTIAKLSCQQAIAAESCFSLAMLAEFEPTLQNAPWRYRELFWEAGAVGQTLYLEAEAAGLRGTGIGCYFDDPVHQLLGLTDNTLQSVYHFTVGGPLVDHRITTLPPYSGKG